MNDLHISVDVETTGRIPGHGQSSMVQLGATVASQLSGGKFDPIVRDLPKDHTFRVNIFELLDTPGDPETRKWLYEQGFNLPVIHGEYADKAMLMFKEWIMRMCAQHGGATPVFVAYPLGFDWSFCHWYFEAQLGSKQDPFGFSSALDIKTLYAAKAGVPISQATKGKMPKALTKVHTAHTHDAQQDSIGQAELFCNVWEWQP